MLDFGCSEHDDDDASRMFYAQNAMIFVCLPWSETRRTKQMRRKVLPAVLKKLQNFETLNKNKDSFVLWFSSSVIFVPDIGIFVCLSELPAGIEPLNDCARTHTVSFRIPSLAVNNTLHLLSSSLFMQQQKNLWFMCSEKEKREKKTFRSRFQLVFIPRVTRSDSLLHWTEEGSSSSSFSLPTFRRTALGQK